VLLTQEQLAAIQAEGLARTTQISQLNRDGTRQAAVTQWQLATGSGETPTVQQLIDARLLDPKYAE
jgi:hypothetical protein